MAETEEVEQLRSRARRRLVGAAAIVLFLVVVPPMLMELEPKPQSSSGPTVEIPQPVPSAPRQPATSNPPDSAARAASAPATPVPEAATVGDAGARPGPAAPAAAVANAPQPAPPQPAAEPAAAPTGLPPSSKKPGAGAKKEAKGEKEAKSAAAPEATLNGNAAGRTVAEAATEGSFFIPLGTFAERDNAQQMLRKAAQLGVKAYSEEVFTTAGARTRVRAGPFSTREAAEKARADLKNAGVDASTVQKTEKRLQPAG